MLICEDIALSGFELDPLADAPCYEYFVNTTINMIKKVIGKFRYDQMTCMVVW